MVCYGCKVELFGYQAYQSMYCSQCLNRRAIEKQTMIQAQIAERQYEMQQEQLRDMQEQRELMESRQRQFQQPVYRQPKPKTVRPYSVILEDIRTGGGLPDPDEIDAAYDIMYENAVSAAVERGTVSIGFLCKTTGLGYGKVVPLIEEMERNGVVGPMNESGVRQVLVS
jgi:DNA segregation ATPase FtsK/SpoIIIE-like protein